MTDLFNHDTDREALGLALARDGVWTHYMYSPPETEIFDRALGLYPCLDVHQGLAKRRRMGMGLGPKEICSSLVEMDEGEHAMEFLRFIKHSTPEGYSHEEGYLEGAENVMTFLANAFVKRMEDIPREHWRSSPVREALKTMISFVDGMFPFVSEAFPAGKAQPLHQPYIARSLYEAGDIELFTMIYDRMNHKTQMALVRDMKEFMCAVKANHLPMQLRLLEKANGNKDELGPIGLSNLTLSFWKDLPVLLKVLKAEGTPANYRQVFDMAIDRFSIESVYQPSDAFKKSKLFPIVSGMAKLLVEVRAAGLELSEKDFRETLRPIEKVATLGKRMQWATPMGDSFATLKADMKAGFDGLPPTELFKRPLPKELAGAMSTVMDDTQWVAKAKLKDQGKIFAQDLGL